MQFADRLHNVETSAIRELFNLLGKPGIISFAGGFPDPALFDAEGADELAVVDADARVLGVLGVSAISPDMKTLLERRESDADAAQAVDMFCYLLRKGIGSLAAALGGYVTSSSLTTTR